MKRGFAPSLFAAGASIAILIGLLLIEPHLPVYGSFFWVFVILAAAVPLSGVVGFLSGRLFRSPLLLSPVVSSWSIPWLGIFLLGASCGLAWDWEGLALYLAVAMTAALAGIVGTVIGAQWRKQRDWLRAIAFCVTLAALSIFWNAMLYATQVAH